MTGMTLYKPWFTIVITILVDRHIFTGYYHKFSSLSLSKYLLKCVHISRCRSKLFRPIVYPSYILRNHYTDKLKNEYIDFWINYKRPLPLNEPRNHVHTNTMQERLLRESLLWCLQFTHTTIHPYIAACVHTAVLAI